jgi:hypothetical protein
MRILSWGPLGELDPLRASYVLQVVRILFHIGVTAILQGKVEREVLREARIGGGGRAVSRGDGEDGARGR